MEHVFVTLTIVALTASFMKASAHRYVILATDLDKTNAKLVLETPTSIQQQMNVSALTDGQEPTALHDL